MPDGPARPVVTISASYGAGGSAVGPRLAERLGVPFVDRAIPAAVSERLAVPLEEALSREELPDGALTRFISSFAPAIQVISGAALPPEAIVQNDQTFLAATEQVLHEYAAGGAVILGRAAAVVLSDVRHALHVRLDGPLGRRISQATVLQSVDRATAEHQARPADRAREAYVRHWYRVNPRDPRQYHLVIDSTAIDIAACVEVIALASASRSRAYA